MPSPATYRILCVDDEIPGLKLRQTILQRRGYLVSAASSVSEALQLFRSEDFDLVVTDHLLGRETGTAMATEMRRLKPNIRIIVLSGTTDVPQGGGITDAFISKAEGTESLLNKVDEFFTRSQQARINSASAADTSFSVESHRWELLASIVESSEDAIYSKTLDGIILSWNKSAERIFGYTAREIVGRSVTTLLPPDHPNEEREILERLRRGEKIARFETVRASKAGHSITVSLTVSPICDSRGRVIGASTIARDITRSKLAEESLRASEKLAVAGRMAATVAHEINNPLEAVTNALYLLAESPSLDESSRDLLVTARDELAKIRQITTLTLGLHRSDAERPREVKVQELIENVLTLYGRKLRSFGISVSAHYTTDATVTAFPGELRQVFSNLIVNAADALEKSGDKLHIHVSDWHDWDNPTQRRVRITIADNGCGISSERQSHIFEPFYTTKGTRGTGVGLWVTLGIVVKYGGKIRLKSSVKPGRSGTTFSVYLPANRALEQERGVQAA